MLLYSEQETIVNRHWKLFPSNNQNLLYLQFEMIDVQ